MRNFLMLSILGWLCLGSCSEEVSSYPVGADFVENDVNVRIIDTFSIKAGTFKLDSLITSGTSRLLLGSVTDDNLGRLTAQTYFQVYPSSYSISTDAVFDSIGLVLNYDTYHYGDTTQVQTYKVHQILESFEPYEGDDFYNTSQLKYDSSEALGEASFIARPNKVSDSIYIPLSHALGEEIFNKIRDNEINNSDDFVRYFKGLTIIPDTLTNSHVLGFGYSASWGEAENSVMRLFYTLDIDDASEGNEQEIDFYIPSTAKQFNAISANLENTPIEQLVDDESITPSYDSNDVVFSQAGTGISAKIEMPSLRDLNAFSEQGAALNAELTFRPLKGSYSNNKPLADSLSVYIIDHKNRIVSQLYDIDSNITYAILNQNDSEFDDNTYYSIDMSGFVEDVLTASYDLNYSIMVQFLDYNKTVDSAVIENFDEEDNNIKLSVTYLNY